MQIIKETITRTYELTCLVPGVYTDSEVAQVKKDLETLIKKHSGTIGKQEDWGKKTLAYKIKQAGKTYSEAYYLYFEVEFETAHAHAFEKDLYLNQKVMRHLFVVADGEESAPAPETQESAS